jgi:hypothetical protein
MWSTGVGADLMKPIAAPIVGGMVTSTIHVLIVTPVIFYLMKLRALRRGTLTGHAALADASRTGWLPGIGRRGPPRPGHFTRRRAAWAWAARPKNPTVTSPICPLPCPVPVRCA